jgi:hypothetical protein
MFQTLKNLADSWVQWCTAIIPVRWKVEIGRIKVRGQPGKKLLRPPYQQTTWAWWYTSVIPITQEAKEGRMQFKVSPEQKHETI